MNEIESEDRMKWWREARFGMFIHWGLYSLLGGTWKNIRANNSPSEWIMAS
nr:alpha-L-fucosidase [bacterium]